jgi:hypothetical protein
MNHFICGASAINKNVLYYLITSTISSGDRTVVKMLYATLLKVQFQDEIGLFRLTNIHIMGIKYAYVFVSSEKLGESLSGLPHLRN